MFIYIVILVHLGGYKVHAPNMVFKTERQCFIYKKLDTDRLVNSAPTPNSEVISMCIKLPEKV